MQFDKKFNVGLTLDTNRAEFAAFLKDYSPLINQIYFSLPLGQKFHSRLKINRQLSDPSTIKLFWSLLEKALEADVKLELALNTRYLEEADVSAAAELLSKRNVNVHSVTFLSDYYPLIEQYFPNKDYIYSYNNGANVRANLDKVVDNYAYYVVGNCNIRNNELFADMQQKGKRVILLLNNGCTFNCPCCSSSTLCKEIFVKNLEKHPIEYLYALQSVMPFELYDGTIDVSNVDLFKISNRTSDLAYLKRCIDSYVNNETASYVAKDPKNFALWGRLEHFWHYFSKMKLETVLKYKKEIVLN